MKKSVREFVLRRLPGPDSYCSCDYHCTKIVIDHVIPKKIIKEQISNKKVYNKAINDPHNLYRCCESINREKGYSLFGKNFYDKKDKSLFSYLARPGLYMQWKYNLNFDKETVNFWKDCDMFRGPMDFEIERSNLIFEKYQLQNPYTLKNRTRYF